MPAFASSRRARIVSASGTGSVWYADRSISAMASARPRSPSSISPIAVMPASSSADHTAAGEPGLPSAAASVALLLSILDDAVERPQHQVANFAHLAHLQAQPPCNHAAQDLARAAADRIAGRLHLRELLQIVVGMVVAVAARLERQDAPDDLRDRLLECGAEILDEGRFRDRRLRLR